MGAPTGNIMKEPRRRDAQATRAAILASAKAQFALAGYEGAFLKEIAADAGVDAALINRYFGGKQGLFEAVLQEAIRSERLFSGDRRRFGRDVAKVFAARAGAASEEGLRGFQLILRAAMSPATAPMLNEAVHAKFIGPIRDWLGGDHAEMRARLISSIFIGLLVEAAVRGAPLSERERGPFVERLGAMLQALVDG